MEEWFEPPPTLIVYVAFLPLAADTTTVNVLLTFGWIMMGACGRRVRGTKGRLTSSPLAGLDSAGEKEVCAHRVGAAGSLVLVDRHVVAR